MQMKLPYTTKVKLYSQSGTLIKTWQTPYEVHQTPNGACRFLDADGYPTCITGGILVIVKYDDSEVAPFKKGEANSSTPKTDQDNH